MNLNYLKYNKHHNLLTPDTDIWLVLIWNSLVNLDIKMINQNMVSLRCYKGTSWAKLPIRGSSKESVDISLSPLKKAPILTGIM